MPKQILHDQGHKLNNKLLHQLTKLCGIKQLKITPYYFESYGAVERMSYTDRSILKTLTDKEKTTWKNHKSKLAFAYKCTKHNFTGSSSYHSLFEYKPRLRIDFTLDQGSKADNFISYDQYLYNWKEAMRQTYNVVAIK